MRQRISFALALMILVGAVGAWAQTPAMEAGRAITQGEFAVLFARHVSQKEPMEGYKTDSAIAYLSGLSNPVVPSEGWKPAEPLTEGVMVQLLATIGINLASPTPDALVSVSKANLVFHRFERRFREYLLYRMATDNQTDSMILDEGDVPAVSAGFVP